MASIDLHGAYLALINRKCLTFRHRKFALEKEPLKATIFTDTETEPDGNNALKDNVIEHEKDTHRLVCQLIESSISRRNIPLTKDLLGVY